MDSTAQRWFDEGHIADAVVGDGAYFVSEPALVIHDRIHVLRQLRRWASSDDRFEAAQRGIEAAVEALLSNGRPDDAVDTLLCLSILADDYEAVPLNPQRVTRWLEAVRVAYAASGEPDRAQEAISQIVKTIGQPPGRT